MHSDVYYIRKKQANNIFFSLTEKKNTNTTKKNTNQVDMGSSFPYGEGGPGGPFHNKNTKVS